MYRNFASASSSAGYCWEQPFTALRRINVFTSFLPFKSDFTGTIDNLSDHLSVHFQAVGVTVVPGDDDVVPLVVIQGQSLLPLITLGPFPRSNT